LRLCHHGKNIRNRFLDLCRGITDVQGFMADNAGGA